MTKLVKTGSHHATQPTIEHTDSPTSTTFSAMATHSSKTTAVLRSLGEEIKCPLCLEIYSSPKRLPCEHVFCNYCLSELLKKFLQRSKTLECPVCRCSFPQITCTESVEQLSTAHQVNRLVDIYRQSLKELDTNGSVSVGTVQSRHAHSGGDAYFSQECEGCIANVCLKEGHACSSARKASQLLQTLTHDLQLVREQHKNLEALQKESTARAEAPLNDESEAVSKIDKSFELYRDILEKEKRRLLSEVKGHYREQMSNNQLKQHKIARALDELEGFLQSAATISTDCSPSEFSQEIGIKKQQGKLLVSQCNELSHQYIQLQSRKLVVELPELDKLKEIFRRPDRNSILISVRRARFKDRDLKLSVGKPFQVEVDVEPLTSAKELRASLVCSYKDHSVPVSVTQMSQMTFKLAATPDMRGKHKLHLLCSNLHLIGSPVSLNVTITPKYLSSSTQDFAIKRMFINSHSLKYHQSKLYVMDEGIGIKVIEKPEAVMAVCKTVPVSLNGELLVHEDGLYLTDQDKRRVIQTDKRGNVLKSVGTRGFGPRLFFGHPNGIRMNAKRHIYICDSYNHCIQVFDRELNFLRTIGKKGKNKGEFHSPDDLVFDSGGNLYVVEQHNHRVQVLSENGTFLHFIGSSMTLNNPTSVAIHGNYVFVTNFGHHCVSVFSLAGEFLANIGKGTLHKPECIAIDDNGFVYVTNNSKELVRF